MTFNKKSHMRKLWNLAFLFLGLLLEFSSLIHHPHLFPVSVISSDSRHSTPHQMSLFVLWGIHYSLSWEKQ
jgi:hypothetical protein